MVITPVPADSGECGERRLKHHAEGEPFYRELKGKQVRIGIEATGHSRWFERLLCGTDSSGCLVGSETAETETLRGIGFLEA
jgi:hypothetical protein